MDLRVGDVMTKGAITIELEDSVQLATELMQGYDIDSIIVVKGGKGIGMVTERDIICKIIADRKDPLETPIKEAMTSPLITITPESDIDDAARKMRDENIRRLVVIEKEKIVGIISDFDITKVEPALHLLIEERSKWQLADRIEDGLGGKVSGLCEECGNYSENLVSMVGKLVCDECQGE